MKRTKILLIVIIGILFCISCSKKTFYFTPDVSGFVYDNETKKPLKNKTGMIVFNGFLDDKPTKITLNNNGSFTLPAKTKKYYLSSPSKTTYDLPPEIFFYFENYKRKTIDYSYFYIKQIDEKNLSSSNHNKINIGIVYLDPEK